VTDQSIEGQEVAVNVDTTDEPVGVESVRCSMPAGWEWPPRCRICGRQSRWVEIASW
jgi:hypothetical protein